MAAYTPYTLDTLMRSLPEIKQRQKRAAQLRREQEEFKAQAKPKAPSNFVQPQYGGGSGEARFSPIARYMPDRSGLGNQVVGSVGDYVTNKRAGVAEQELDQATGQGLLGAAQQYGAPAADLKNALGIPNTIARPAPPPDPHGFRATPAQRPPVAVDAAAGLPGGAAPIQGAQPAQPLEPPAVPGLHPLEPLAPSGTLDRETLHQRQMNQESALNPNAVSPAGARGLMQLMPATARELERRAGLPHGSSDRDPAINEKLGRSHMDELLQKYGGDHIMALVAYNRGEPNADKWAKAGKKMEDLPAETQGYLAKILGPEAMAGAAPSEAPPAVEPGTPGMPADLMQALGVQGIPGESPRGAFGMPQGMAPGEEGPTMPNKEALRMYMALIGGPEMADVVPKATADNVQSTFEDDEGQKVLIMESGEIRGTGKYANFGGTVTTDQRTGEKFISIAKGRYRGMSLPLDMVMKNPALMGEGAEGAEGATATGGPRDLTVYEQKRLETEGKVETENRVAAQAALPKIRDTAASYTRDIDKLLNNEQGINDMVGKAVTARLSGVPLVGDALAKGWAGTINAGTPLADAFAANEQISNIAFLEGYADSLKGTGQVSNIEGLKTAAARLQAALYQRPETYKQRLIEFKEEWNKHLQRADNAAASGAQSAPSSAGSIDDWEITVSGG